MKTLLLIRHAKSSWSHPGLNDFDRPLNGRGKRAAPLMASVLSEREIHPGLILSSPAKRALKTARVFAKHLGYSRDQIVTDPAIYENGVLAIPENLRGLGVHHETVLVFGHNPDMTELAERFSGIDVGNIPTCGIFCMEFDISTWADVGNTVGGLVFYDIPRNYTD